MVDYNLVKTFKITDPEDPEKQIDVEMTVGQRIELKMKEVLINEIRGLKLALFR